MTRTRLLAVGLWSAFLVALIASIYVGFNPPRGNQPIALSDAIWASSIIGFPTAGALIATRLPTRPLGWILLISPLCIMTGVFLGDGPVDFATPDQARYYAVVANCIFNIGMNLLVLTPLLMPDGRFRSEGWRRVARIVLIGGGVLLVTAAVEPGPLTEYPEYVNPFGIRAVGPMTDLVRFLEGPFYLLALGAGIVSIFQRFRASTGQERQQMKWLALSVGVIGICVVSGPVLQAVGLGISDVFITFTFVIAFLAFPTALAIAVLRYRLYDVDVIINRALVYGALTALLAVAYLLVIFVFRSLLPLASGSDVGVAASTLLVAAMFQPLRVRVQRFIDRRFYRRRYDAGTTLARFSSRLRDEVELDRIRDDALGVVEHTLQPAHASIWMRGTA